jgi:hypothetical protein
MKAILLISIVVFATAVSDYSGCFKRSTDREKFMKLNVKETLPISSLPTNYSWQNVNGTNYLTV